jgi:hypothetical protein
MFCSTSETRCFTPFWLCGILCFHFILSIVVKEHVAYSNIQIPSSFRIFRNDNINIYIYICAFSLSNRLLNCPGNMYLFIYCSNTYFLSSPVCQTCLIDLYRKMTEHFRPELFDDSVYRTLSFHRSQHLSRSLSKTKYVTDEKKKRVSQQRCMTQNV